MIYVAGIPILVARSGGRAGRRGRQPWHTWVLSDHADDGPYVVAIRAMLGLEKGIYLRQNLANAFIVNYLWLPALLALVTWCWSSATPLAACAARWRCCAASPWSTPGRRSRSRRSPSRAMPRR